MITPDEIKRTAFGWWPDVLVSFLQGKQYFPKAITRIGKIKPGATVEKFGQIQDELNLLRSESKEVKGLGYTIAWGTVSSRKVGENSFPQKIYFENETDYLKFIKKEKDFATFKKCSVTLINALPALEKWIEQFPESVISNASKWDDLIVALTYFTKNPHPQLYLRQLPLPLHTKFIEQNQAVIASCLEALIPSELNQTEKTFERRFNLRYDEPLIRIRILDDSLAIDGITDISVPLSQFKALKLKCSRIVVTENKMSFLALPQLDDAIAIWSGGGFYIRYLADVKWLDKMEIIYWGDIDVHGLAILDQMRGYFPQTKSILMDRLTIETFTSDVGNGNPISNYKLPHLTAEELHLFEYLKSGNLRLEQEKLPHRYVIDALYRL